MSIYKGEKIEIEIYGESHSARIGANVKNMPKTQIDFNALSEFLERRKASGGVFSTARREADIPVFDGLTEGMAEGDYAFYIENTNVKSSDYDELYGKPRPSHADLAWHYKDGALDFSGGGRFSGRLTAPLCVVGGICKQYLESKGVYVYAYVSQTGNVKGASYKTQSLSADEIVKARDDGGYPSLDKKGEMLAEIAAAKSEKDSVGGKIECVVFGLKGGFGDNLFGGLEGKISSLIYSVPAVKGVEFGDGFDLCAMRGSEANDEPYAINGGIGLRTNRAGGINGGISNGAPILLSVAMRPTPSIGKKQRTVDLLTGQDCEIEIKGRHDACIVPRAVPCIESAVCIALTDIVK